jgi:hypothetical protein
MIAVKGRCVACGQAVASGNISRRSGILELRGRGTHGNPRTSADSSYIGLNSTLSIKKSQFVNSPLGVIVT